MKITFENDRLKTHLVFEYENIYLSHIEELLEPFTNDGDDSYTLIEMAGFGYLNTSLETYNNDLEGLCSVAEGIRIYGFAYSAYIKHMCFEYADFEDCYKGLFQNKERFASSIAEDRNLFDNCGSVVKRHFDFSSYADELEADAYTFIPALGANEFYVFEDY